MKRSYVKLFAGFCVLATPFFAVARDATNNFLQQSYPFYVSASGGIFHGSFDAEYLDQTDAIPQNISDNFNQNGYTGGLAFGYSKLFNQSYFLGGELSANYNTQQGKFQAGANTTAFSDELSVRHNFDLTFVPGVLLTDSLAAYLKAGVSMGSIEDTLTSPVGYNPTTNVEYSRDRYVPGFVAGIGMKKYLTHRFSVFTEYDYHDYGKVSFSNFQNYTTTYTHSARVYASAVSVGAALSF